MIEQDENPLPNKNIVLFIVLIAVVVVVTAFSVIFSVLSPDIPKGNAQTNSAPLVRSNQ